MNNEMGKANVPNITTIQISKEMIKDVPPKIHIVRSKKGAIIEDILLDNGESKKGIRYFLDPETLASLGACEISIGQDQVVKEHNNRSPMAGFNKDLPEPYGIPKSPEANNMPSAPDNVYDPSNEKTEELDEEEG